MSSNEGKSMVDSKFWDAAVLITIVTGVFYISGFTYWFSFFKYFSIPKEFIDLPFEQIISTTWVFVLCIIVGILVFTGVDIFNIKKAEDYSYGK